jgi:hypothetical protein
MIQNKLIRAKSGNENTSNFSTFLDPPIVLSENSSIALSQFNMELTENVIDITTETQKLAYSNLLSSSQGYGALIADHTFNIPIGTYSAQELAYNLTIESNKKLYYEGTLEHQKEQGAEFLFNYNSIENQIKLIYAGRLANQFCGTPTANVSQTNTAGTTYTYSLDPNNNNGIITRTGATQTDFDFFFYSTIPFCRGSGEATVTINSAPNFVVGLINPIHLLSNPSPATILNKISYGALMIGSTSTNPNFTKQRIYIKKDEETPWGITNRSSANKISIILGRVTGFNSNQYNINIKLDNLNNLGNYKYGNYVLICASYSQTRVFTYNICESKIVSSTTTTEKGYYNVINPDYLNITNNNFISLENIKDNDDSVGFIPGQAGSKLTLELFNDETRQLYGFTTKTIVSDDIFSANDNIIDITPTFRINTRYEIPDSLKLVIDVPLDSYDNGRSENILSIIPNNINNGYITYQPSPPLYITLKNNSKFYLDHINFKLYDNNNNLIPPQTSASAVVIIQSIKQ